MGIFNLTGGDELGWVGMEGFGNRRVGMVINLGRKQCPGVYYGGCELSVSSVYCGIPGSIYSYPVASGEVAAT